MNKRMWYDKKSFGLNDKQDKLHVNHIKVNGKAISVHAWTGPEGSRRLRFSDFKTTGT